jgi:hypothetical protein
VKTISVYTGVLIFRPLKKYPYRDTGPSKMKTDEPEVVESKISSYLHFISSPFSASHGEWRILMRASTEDEFAIPDGWETIEIPEEDPSPQIVNQVPIYHL